MSGAQGSARQLKCAQRKLVRGRIGNSDAGQPRMLMVIKTDSHRIWVNKLESSCKDNKRKEH